MGFKDLCKMVMIEETIQQKLYKILFQWELVWHQRLKKKWIVEGDRNTCLYHVKGVQMLKDANGNWIEDTTIIKKMFNDSYHNPHYVHHYRPIYL